MPTPHSVVASAAAIAAFAAASLAQIRIAPYAARHVPCIEPSSGRVWEANDYAVGDFDGDGDLDVVMAENLGAPLLLRNRGDGDFAPPQTLPLGHMRTSLVLARDFDGDNDLDLFLCGGGTSNGVSRPCALLRNDGSGNFTQSPSLPLLASIAQRVHAGDLDGDGDLDVMVEGSPSLYLRNDGGGAFSNQGASVPAFGELCHLDQDGHLDIVAGGTAWFGSSSGTFTAVALPVTPEFVADLDGDADLDLLGGSPRAVHRNDGTGRSFPAVGSLPLLSGTPSRTPHHAVDLDGDGHLELLQLDAHTRPVVLKHTGNFVYAIATTAFCEVAPATAVDGVWAACAWFDADGDGDLDWLTGGSERRGASSTTTGIAPQLYLDAGASPGPRFRLASRPPFPRQQVPGVPAASGDVDGDGDVDLVFDGLWLQDRSGRFAPGPALPPPAGVPATPLCGPGTLADLDADGDLDLFLTDGPGRSSHTTPRAPRLLRNNGAATFTAMPVPASVSTVGTACAAGDVDGDGDLDLVLGSRSSSLTGSGERVVLLRNDGNFVFVDATSQMPALSFQTGDLSLRDLDGDGDLDLLLGTEVAFHSSPSMRYLVNDGSGNFTDRTLQRLPQRAEGYRLAVADFDGDGDLDFAQLDWVNLGAHVYTNTGAGTFTYQHGSRGTHVVDWTGDGALVDLFDDHFSGFSIGTTFVPWTFAFQDRAPVVLLPFDYDQDGDLDVAAGCQPAFGSTQLAIVQQGLVVNLHRDLRFATLPRIGQPLRLALRAANGTAATVAFVATTTGFLPQRVPVPGVGRGTVAVDVNQLVALDFVVVPDADTTVEVVRPVPLSPVFVGLEVAAQALFVPVGNEANAHFSNAVAESIGR